MDLLKLNFSILIQLVIIALFYIKNDEEKQTIEQAIVFKIVYKLNAYNIKSIRRKKVIKTINQKI